MRGLQSISSVVDVRSRLPWREQTIIALNMTVAPPDVPAPGRSWDVQASEAATSGGLAEAHVYTARLET